MTQKTICALTAIALSWAPPGRAAPVDPAEPLPPGHPPMGATPSEPLPPGHPPTGAAATATLPPGHPPTSTSAAPLPPGHPSVSPGDDPDDSNPPAEALPPGHPPMADPDDENLPRPPEDRVLPAPDLRAGTVEIVVQDGASVPQPGVPVRLGILRQEVAEGDTRDQRDGVTDARGVVSFQGLPTGSGYSYRANVERGVGHYATAPFRLDEMRGQRALLHVYPVSRDLREALVGMRAVVFIQPREDVFSIEANFRVLNIGRNAWVPDGVTLELPEGAKGFRANESMNDTRVEKTASGAIALVGTYPPGEHEVSFQFQLDNRHERTKELRVPLLPHVAEIRVFAEKARGMTLEVEGLPEAQSLAGEDGTPLLGTGKRLARGETPLGQLAVRLANVPVPSEGRWYAAFAALALSLGGFIGAVRRKGEPRRRDEDAADAEGILLDELVELEKLRSQDRIGPRTYQSSRAELLDALARLQAARR